MILKIDGNAPFAPRYKKRFVKIMPVRTDNILLCLVERSLKRQYLEVRDLIPYGYIRNVINRYIFLFHMLSK